MIMKTILDIHTHKVPPQPEAVVNIPRPFTPEAVASLFDGQLYSAGIHPWDSDMPGVDDLWDDLRRLCETPQVVAIGECGIDKLKGAPLFRQMNLFKRHVELSESIGKPLIIHCVRAHDIIIGLKKELHPAQNWLVHGFRGKPSIAKMFTDAGIFISFGCEHNDETVKEIPIEFMLAETDDSASGIRDVVESLSMLRGGDVAQDIARNASRFLNLK